MENQTKAVAMVAKSTTMVLCLITFVAGLFLGSVAISMTSDPATAQAPVLPQAAEGDGHDHKGLSPELAHHIDDLEKEIARDPKLALNWVHLGNAYFDAQLPDKAIPAYEQALLLQPNNADVTTDLGTMYRATGQVVKALAAFDQAITLMPTHQHAHFNKGLTFIFDQDKLEEGLQIWQTLLQINPQANIPSGTPLATALVPAILNRAEAREVAGNKEGALKAVNLALDAEAANAQALLLKASLLEDLGRKDEALAVWKNLLQVQPDAKNRAGKAVKDILVP